MSLLNLDLIEAIYSDAERELTNDELYREVQSRLSISDNDFNKKEKFGLAGVPHNKIKHRIRWFQQTLKAMNVIERISSGRSLWRHCRKNKSGLSEVREGACLVAFSTDLGVAILGNSTMVLPGNTEPVHLCLTSPPYPLRKQRDYAAAFKNDSEYIDFIVEAIRPIARQLVNGGSVVLNIGQDIFNPGQPSRSLYPERLLLALCEKLDLYLMDRVPWVNMSKPPSPTYWACRKKVQLLAGHEMIFWLTNNPDAVRSCNQRVLQPHTESHSALVARGGENRTTIYGDGAHVVKPGAFSQSTDGAIPKNVIIRGHACADTRRFHQEAKRLGLPAHGAIFPTAIPDFFIRFLTEENELVVDPFAGSLKTGLAAERLNRRWMCFDSILEWLRISATGFFSDFPGFEMNPIIDNGELFA